MRRLAAVLAFVGFTFGLVALPATASAAQPVSVNCATSSLQSAIDSAVPGATLLVSGTCDGNFTISKDLTLQGDGTAVLDGQNAGTTLFNMSDTVTVQGLKITGGGFSAHENAGIVNEGTLTVRDSVISGNAGGFLAGGGILNSGVSLTVQGSTISDNTGGQILGGGIINTNFSTATVSDSTIANNTSQDGGITGVAKQLTVKDTTITGNTGGAIQNASGDVTVNNSTITGNTATGSGGGITVIGGDVTVNDTTVSNNTTAMAGGGVLIEDGSATLNNSTVTGNTANQSGGGIFVASLPASVTLRSTTVTGNNPDNCAPAGAVAGCVG